MSEFEIPSYLVFLDTNPLFSRKPDEPIAKSAVSSLNACRKLAKVSAHVPQVVASELSFQQYRHALAASENLRKNLTTIEGAVGIKLPEPPPPDQLVESAKTSISEVFAENGIEIIPTPVGAIDWQEVVNDSCWRNCVFEPPPEDQPQFEKGFRDRMVLETVIASCNEHSKGNELVFITNDARTSYSARERAKRAGLKLTIHSRISELESEINLTKKTKDENYAKAIFETIETVFYKEDDPGCLFYKFSVKEKILEKFGMAARNKMLLSILSPNKKLSGTASTHYQALAGAGLRLNMNENLESYSGLRLQIRSAEFSPSEDGLYHWKTRVNIHCLFERRASPFSGSFSLQKDLILVTKVDVLWSCDICPKTATIISAQVDGIESGGLSEVREGDVLSRLKYAWPLFRNRSAEGEDEERQASDIVMGED